MVMEMVISSKVLKAQLDEMQKREDERNSSLKYTNSLVVRQRECFEQNAKILEPSSSFISRNNYIISHQRIIRYPNVQFRYDIKIIL